MKAYLTHIDRNKKDDARAIHDSAMNLKPAKQQPLDRKGSINKVITSLGSINNVITSLGSINTVITSLGSINNVITVVFAASTR